MCVCVCVRVQEQCRDQRQRAQSQVGDRRLRWFGHTSIGVVHTTVDSGVQPPAVIHPVLAVNVDKGSVCECEVFAMQLVGVEGGRRIGCDTAGVVLACTPRA